MSQVYGIEASHAGRGGDQQPPARYLVLIESACEGARLARLFLENRTEVADFDAGTPEVQRMTEGLVAARGAAGAEWDAALGGHSAAERAAADVYTLDV